MLNCTEVNGQSVLFYDGDVHCLQSWQYGVIVAVCVFVIPFFSVLLFAPRLLQTRRIGPAAFLLSFVFPLFAVVPVVYLFIQEFHQDKRELTAHSKRDWWNGADNEDSSSINPNEPRTCLGDPGDQSTDLLVDVVFGPYENNHTVMEHNYKTKKPNLYGLCWEGFINLRRLIAVILAVYVNDALVKHICLTMACFVFLLIHLRVKPFKHAFSNYAESVALVLLLNLAAMNLVKAAFYNSQTIPRDIGYLVIVGFEWVETATLVILPACIVVLLLLSLVIKTGRKAVHRRESNAGNEGLDGDEDNSGRADSTEALTVVGQFRSRADLTGGKDSQRRMIRHLAGGVNGSLGGPGSATDLLRSYDPSLPRAPLRSPWVPFSYGDGSTPMDGSDRSDSHSDMTSSHSSRLLRHHTPHGTPRQTSRDATRRMYPQQTTPSRPYESRIDDVTSSRNGLPRQNQPSHLLRY